MNSVYCYVRKKEGSLRYIGSTVGEKKRSYQRYKFDPHTERRLIIAANLSAQDASALESHLIACFGEIFSGECVLSLCCFRSFVEI